MIPLHLLSILKIILLFAYIILFFLFFISILISRKIIKVTYRKEKCLSAYRNLEESPFLKISPYILVIYILSMAFLSRYADKFTRDILFMGIFALLYGILGFYLLKKIFKLLGEAQ